MDMNNDTSADQLLRGFSLVYRITPGMTAEAVFMTTAKGGLEDLSSSKI
jgi:hypothetical protein